MEYFEVRAEEDRIVLIPVKAIPSNQTIERIREKIKRARLTGKDIEEAVERVVKIDESSRMNIP